MKNELTGNKIKPTEPEWLWWPQLSAIFGGTLDQSMADVSATGRKLSLTSSPARSAVANGGKKSVPETVIDQVHKELVARVIVSPIKYNDYVTKETQNAPSVIRSRRRTMAVTAKTREDPLSRLDDYIAEAPKMPSRRRTIAPKAIIAEHAAEASINEPPPEEESAKVESPATGAKRRRPNTKSPAEKKVSPVKILSPKPQAKTDSARKRRANATQESLVEESTPPVNNLNASKAKFTLQITPLSNTSFSGRKRKTDEANFVEPMDTVETIDAESSLNASLSSPRITGDECISTAMFVETRLRASNGFKRQRLIYKIHELFYQEEVDEQKNSSRQ